MALLCFHSSRFKARTNMEGHLILYDNQNKEKWDTDLIEKGKDYLNISAKGEATKYHLEAGISFWHTQKESALKWENILQLYNHLLQIEYSPIAALNRTYTILTIRQVIYPVCFYTLFVKIIYRNQLC